MMSKKNIKKYGLSNKTRKYRGGTNDCSGVVKITGGKNKLRRNKKNKNRTRKSKKIKGGWWHNDNVGFHQFSSGQLNPTI